MRSMGGFVGCTGFGGCSVLPVAINKGIKIFGHGGIQAVKVEVMQLHEGRVTDPGKLQDLTPEQRAVQPCHTSCF